MLRIAKFRAKLLQALGFDHPARAPRADWIDQAAFDTYVGDEPNPQNAIDLLPGWNNAFPPEIGVRAGGNHHYIDHRIDWCIAQFGSLDARKVLELGPLEGLHTYMLDRQDPAELHAIEANKLAFMRCLIARELLQLKRAQFFLGNFMPWLEQHVHDYDLIVASGVLYHMVDPLGMLEAIGRQTHAVYLWTHYFDEAAMPPEDTRRGAFPGVIKVSDFHGREVRLHQRSYHGADKNTQFCGGMYDTHFWLEREDILTILRDMGFDDIRTTHEHADHPLGPAFSVFARRSAVATTFDRGYAEVGAGVIPIASTRGVSVGQHVASPAVRRGTTVTAIDLRKRIVTLSQPTVAGGRGPAPPPPHDIGWPAPTPIWFGPLEVLDEITRNGFNQPALPNWLGRRRLRLLAAISHHSDHTTWDGLR